MSNILINEPKPRLVPFGDIITPGEIKSLRHFVAVSQSPSGPLELGGDTPHKAIVKWARSTPGIIKRWKRLQLLPDYAAYLLEYHLQLSCT